MSRVQEIEQQLQTLSAEEWREFRAWLHSYEDEIWDKRFATEVASGKWDALADRALLDHTAGKSTPL